MKRIFVIGLAAILLSALGPQSALAGQGPLVSINGAPSVAAAGLPQSNLLLAQVTDPAYGPGAQAGPWQSADLNLPWRQPYWGTTTPSKRLSAQPSPQGFKAEFDLARLGKPYSEDLSHGALAPASRETGQHGPWRDASLAMNSSRPFNARLLALSSYGPDSMWLNRFLPLAYLPARDQAAMVDNTLSGDHQQSGYVAFYWRTGSLGFTIGGGYERSSQSASIDTSGGQSGGFGLSGLSSGGKSTSSSQYSSDRRWSAFVAIPYQITDRFGFAPELSYHKSEASGESDDPGNEWVMGLQFNFGF